MSVKEIPRGRYAVRWTGQPGPAPKVQIAAVMSSATPRGPCWGEIVLVAESAGTQEADAQATITAMNNTEFDGRTIRVDKASDAMFSVKNREKTLCLPSRGCLLASPEDSPRQRN
ncbi:hypothetical protein V8E51_014380 [Hyaloscypha variabilis]